MIESDYLKDNSEIIEKLRKIPAPQSFEEKEFNGLLRLSKIKKYESGELIIKEDTYDDRIFFIVSGKVRVTKHGKELTVLRRRGDLFGEMGIIDGSARSASVMLSIILFICQ